MLLWWDTLCVPGALQPRLPTQSLASAVPRHFCSSWAASWQLRGLPRCVQAGVKRSEFAICSQLSHIRALQSLALPFTEKSSQSFPVQALLHFANSHRVE